MRLQKTVYSTLAFGIIVLAQPVFNAPLAHAANVPVRVINTPLPVQGTVNANITNSSVPVSGSVSVSNTPDAPLFAEIENAARSAVAATCNVDFTDPPSQVNCQLGTVPLGKILVIEMIACGASTSIGGTIGPISLVVGAPHMSGGVVQNTYFNLALTKVTTIPEAYDQYAFTSQIRAYSVPGSTVYISAVGEKPLVARTSVSCTIAGHLVNQ